MKNIGMIYNAKKRKIFKDERIDKSFRTFCKMAQKNGCRIILGRPEYYKKRRLSGWVFEKEWKKVFNQDLDFVLDFTCSLKYANVIKRASKEIITMNHPYITKLSTDKYLTYKKFKKYSPRTVLIKSRKHMKSIIKQNLGRNIVLKPRYGIQGIGVYAGLIKEVPDFKKTMKKLPTLKTISNNYLFKEFIDSRNGFLKEIHDIRLYVINGKVIYHYSRVPKEGYLTNLEQGGHVVTYPKEHIPKKAMQITKIVDNKLKKYYPRFYAIDFMVHNSGKAYIIELNAFPGFSYLTLKERSKTRERVFKEFFSEIKKVIM